MDYKVAEQSGPVLFTISINGLEDGMECILTRFTDDTKLGSVTDTPEHFAAIQRDFNRLEKMGLLNVCGKVWEGWGVLQRWSLWEKVKGCHVPVTVGPAGPATAPPQAKAY